MTDEAAERAGADDETRRAWLVERSYDDRNLITLVYATRDGRHQLRKEQSATVMHQQGTAVTAAVEAPASSFAPVDEGDVERFAAEAERMAAAHAPDDEV